MGTYLVPTTAAYCYEPYDYLYMVYATSPEEAYDISWSDLYGTYIPQHLERYEYYVAELKKPLHNPFPVSAKYDILEKTLGNTIERNEHMTHFQVNWKDYTNDLLLKADNEGEKWSNETYPNNGILTNYLVHTCKRLSSEKQIIRQKEYGLFNTGLFTKYYEPLYAYSDSNYKVSFCTGHELNQRGISERPQRANYFTDPSLLLFDWHYPIDINYKHILEDDRNKERLPKGFINKENKMNILIGAIELMKQKVSANYKLAIPQCYEDKIQLLLPLCLDTDNGKPDLALAVTKLENCYQGYTCLTLDMAYNNARLIAKPESNWLIAENIQETETTE